MVLQASQPPCEAVNWNFLVEIRFSVFHSQPPCEAVNWNTFIEKNSLCGFCQPPCEAVNWNKNNSPDLLVIAVSLLARLWIEIPYLWKWCMYIQSASLRGCELKFFWCVIITVLVKVSLLARLWIEIRWWYDVCPVLPGQPPCEAVNWNVDNWLYSKFWSVSLLARLWIEIITSHSDPICNGRQPPCEAVNWNHLPQTDKLRTDCQPPCEAVNWNVDLCDRLVESLHVSLLARLWIEICLWDVPRMSLRVSLLARLWIEIPIYVYDGTSDVVSLLARLWIEILFQTRRWIVMMSASLRGCELKYPQVKVCSNLELSASLRGCELKYATTSGDISCNESASLRGCELKYGISKFVEKGSERQPPCEAVNWNSFSRVD